MKTINYIFFNARAKFQTEYPNRAQELENIVWSLQRVSDKAPIFISAGKDAYDYMYTWIRNFDTHTQSIPTLSGVEVRISNEIPSNSVFLSYGDDLGDTGILIENIITNFSEPYKYIE